MRQCNGTAIRVIPFWVDLKTPNGGPGGGRQGGGDSCGDGEGGGGPPGEPYCGSGGSVGGGRAPPPLLRRGRGILGWLLNLSSATSEVPLLVGMHPEKPGIVVDVTRQGGTAKQPVVLPVSAKYAVDGFGGDYATRAEPWADVRCGYGATHAWSDDDSVAQAWCRRTRRSSS